MVEDYNRLTDEMKERAREYGRHLANDYPTLAAMGVFNGK